MSWLMAYRSPMNLEGLKITVNNNYNIFVIIYKDNL